MGIAVAVAVVFIFICVRGEQEFRVLRSTTEDYISCEKAANQLQQGSNYLTEQVRLYTMTGDSTLPDVILETELSAEDQALSADEKIEKAQQMVSDGEYQKQTNEISSKVKECTTSLVEKTRNRQARSASIFSDMYLKLEIGIILYKRAWKTWLSFLLKNRDKGHL